MKLKKRITRTISISNEGRIKELENESIKNAIELGKLKRKIDEMDDILMVAVSKLNSQKK